MTEKAYAAGSKFPELQKNKLRVYSMRFCPYAQRTLLVLGHYKIPHEVININLKSKPEWFLTKTPFGLVPVLEQDDKIVCESAICDEYLDELYGKPSLLPHDPYLKARTKIMMEAFSSKVIPKFYSFYRESTEEERSKSVQDLHSGLKLFEEDLSGKYFGGNEPSMLDYHIWPFFERMPSVKKLRGIDMLPADKFPKLSKWVENMLQLPAVKAVYHETDRHEAFMKSYLAGGTPEYDLGL